MGDIATIDPRFVPIRFSTLKSMATSPLHYRHACQSQFEETLSMRLGTGTHALTFGTPKVVVFKARRAGKVWDAFKEEHANDVILSEKEFAIASAMTKSLTTDIDADPLLFAPGTQHELDVRWTFMGRACRGRLDALSPTAVVDIKGVKDANPRWFPTQAARMAWHAQVTWYADGVEAAGLGWRHPHLVAVENSAPFAVTVWRLSERAILQGRQLYRSWFERVLECEAKGEWPGYSSGVLEFDVPNFLRTAPIAVDELSSDEEAMP